MRSANLKFAGHLRTVAKPGTGSLVVQSAGQMLQASGPFFIFPGADYFPESIWLRPSSQPPFSI
jgi:hypothetical protein